MDSIANKKVLNISLLDFVIALIAFSILFFSFILSIALFLKKTGNKRSHVLLGLLVLLSSLVLMDYLILLVGLPGQYNELYYLPLDFGLSIGPLQYFYFKSKLNPGYQFKKNHLVHLGLPALQAIIILYVGFSSVSFKYVVWTNGFMNIFQLTVSILFLVVCAFYGIKSYFLLKKNLTLQKPWKKQLYDWLVKFLWVLAVLIVIQSAFLIFHQISVFNNNVLSYVQFFLLLLLLLWFSLKAWQQNYPHLIFVGNDFDVGLSEKNQTMGSSLDIFKAKTEVLFEQQQIFTNPDFNLDILKKEYDLSKRKISEMIKEIYGQSFTEFVNHYRVNYVLSALKSGEHHSVTLLAIAFDAGFSSKSTFYRSFKQITKYTPTEYLRQLKA